MGKRQLSPAELRAYQELARAAKRLRQAAARADRQRDRGAALSNPPDLARAAKAVQT